MPEGHENGIIKEGEEDLTEIGRAMASRGIYTLMQVKGIAQSPRNSKAKRGNIVR